VAVSFEQDRLPADSEAVHYTSCRSLMARSDVFDAGQAECGDVCLICSSLAERSTVVRALGNIHDAHF
jgi:hypothetical protein